MTVCAVEDRVRRRRPFRLGGQRAPALINAARLQLALGGLLVRHRDEIERRLLGHDKDLCEWLAESENMRFPFGRRFEHQEKDHWPPPTDERWDGNRGRIRGIGVEARGRFRPHRPTFLTLKRKRQRLSVIEIAEGPERRPLAAMPFGGRAEFAVKRKLPSAYAHAQLVCIRIEQLDSVTSAFRKWEAMPGLLHRPVSSGLAFAAPAGDFELRAPRIESGRKRTILHLHGRAILPQSRISMHRGGAFVPANEVRIWRQETVLSSPPLQINAFTVSTSFGMSTA